MRHQIKLTYQIGMSGTMPDAFRSAIIAAASALCGGCTEVTGHGYWINGETHAETFCGTVETEDMLCLEVTTEPHKTERVAQHMQRAIAESVALFALPINWVHVSETRMTGRHFSVADMLADAVA